MTRCDDAGCVCAARGATAAMADAAWMKRRRVVRLMARHLTLDAVGRNRRQLPPAYRLPMDVPTLLMNATSAVPSSGWRPRFGIAPAGCCERGSTASGLDRMLAR